MEAEMALAIASIRRAYDELRRQGEEVSDAAIAHILNTTPEEVRGYRTLIPGLTCLFQIEEARRMERITRLLSELRAGGSVLAWLEKRPCQSSYHGIIMD